MSKTMLSALFVLASGTTFADPVHLTPVSTGGMSKVGFYYPQKIELTDTKPAGIKVEPAGLKAASYGEFKLGGKSFFVIVDRPDSGDSKLYVDTNGDGDLTNDAPSTWKSRPYMGGADRTVKCTQYMGNAMVNIGLGGNDGPASLGVYMFDKTDAGRPELKNTLLYYADYAYEGPLKLGDKTYHVVLANTAGNGDFATAGGEADGPAAAMLLIDVNGNGKFDSRGESYDVHKPFNIGGKTYEIKNMAVNGSSFEVATSSQPVAEIQPTPSLGVGAKAIAFQAKTTKGKAISFPRSFKGKVVLLDFWATWCGPCMEEVPNVVASYKKFHGKGFEILGISLDNKDTIKEVGPVTKKKGMTWQQVADGKYWSADVAKLYAIDSIPQAFLVDGDTGKILAQGDAIRGDALEKAIKAALANKAKAHK